MTPDEARRIYEPLPVIDVQDASLIGWEPLTREFNPSFDRDILELITILRENAERGRKSKLVKETTGKVSIWTPPIAKPVSLDVATYRAARLPRPRGYTLRSKIPHPVPSMPKKTDTPPTRKPDKLAIANLCDPDTYLEIITACLPEGKGQKDMPPAHLANAMALMAELLLGNHAIMSGPFSDENSLQVGFTLKFSKEKDTLEISYYPGGKIKDSASKSVDDPNQSTLDEYAKKKAAETPEPPEEQPVIDVLGLPAPEPLGLPEPANDGIIDAEVVESDDLGILPKSPAENDSETPEPPAAE
jgi:hypothetical protein